MQQRTANNPKIDDQEKSSSWKKFVAYLATLFAVIGGCEQVFSLLNNSCQWAALFGTYPPQCKKPEEKPSDLRPPLQENDLPTYRVNYHYYDIENRKWVDTIVQTRQVVTVQKAVFQLIDHQSEYRSTFDRLNTEISKRMANAMPVTEYLSLCITKVPDLPSNNVIEYAIENRINNALDAINSNNSTNEADADTSDASDEPDGALHSEPEQKLSIASEVRLHSYGMISILFEYSRKCNRIDSGSTIFRDSINVNLALPEADRFAIERMADLSPIFHSCQRLDGIPFFAENGTILCYKKSETKNTDRPYFPIKEYSNIELYRQFQEPILKYQFERLVKPPGL